MSTEAQKAASRKHYAANKEYYRQRNIKRRLENQKYIRSLREVPCTDCGVQYPWYVMELFDHVEEKTYHIGRMASYHRGAIDKELKKCEVVCANCHCARTHERREAG